MGYRSYLIVRVVDEIRGLRVCCIEPPRAVTNARRAWIDQELCGRGGVTTRVIALLWW